MLLTYSANAVTLLENYSFNRCLRHSRQVITFLQPQSRKRSFSKTMPQAMPFCRFFPLATHLIVYNLFTKL